MKSTIYNAQQLPLGIKKAEDHAKAHLMAGRRVEISVEAETRDNEQNKQQWPILQAFADQLLWPVNGQMVKMEAEEWKDVLTSAFRNETVRLAMGLNGGVVMLGGRTSKFKRHEWPEWIEFLNSVAVDRGVRVPISKRQAAEMGFTAQEEVPA